MGNSHVNPLNSSSHFMYDTNLGEYVLIKIQITFLLLFRWWFKMSKSDIYRNLEWQECITYFYNVNNGSSCITSKISSKNLSNENIHTLGFQRIGILDHVLSWRQQNYHCLFSLLRFFDKLFEEIIDDLFFTL